jgi:hypothetical protein
VRQDQHTPGQIKLAEIVSVTQEDLQSYILSQVKQIIFGDHPGRWFDDFRSTGIPSLYDLTGISGLAHSKIGISLLGARNGLNRTFTTPDYFVHDLPTGKTVEVFHNGRRLAQSATADPRDGDYYVTGSISGFDTINLLSFAPVGGSVLVANYQVLP